MVGKISVGGQGVDVLENKGRNGYRRWEKKSSKRVRSERSRENYAIFRNRKRAKGRKPTEKAREPGM